MMHITSEHEALSEHEAQASDLPSSSNRPSHRTSRSTPPPRGIARVSAIAVALLTAVPLTFVCFTARPAMDAEGDFTPVAFASAAPEPMRPGWLATYGPVDGRAFDGGVIRTHASAPTFALMPMESVHPIVPAAGLTASFNAIVKIPDAGTYRFIIEGEGGKVEINITGTSLPRPVSATADLSAGAGRCETAWVNLPAGDVAVRIGFERAGDKPARLRPMWEKQGEGDAGFMPEPIPVSLCSPPPFGVRDAQTGLAIHRGRVLLAQMGCVSCHEAGAGATKALAGPDLTAVGSRADPAWILAWIENPQKHAPGGPMPTVLTESRQDKAAAQAILHFLMNVSPPPDTSAAATEPAVHELGQRLFHSVGCVACHGPFEGGAEFMPRVPYGNLAQKWHPASLSAFLQDPVAVHPSGQMPSFNLTQAEADAVATYLVGKWGAAGTAAFEVDPSRIAAGRTAFAARGCASCHTVTENAWRVESTLKARALGELRADRGCMSQRDTRTPRYTFTPEQRADLTAAIEQIKKWGTRPRSPAPVDMGRLTLDVMECRACHESCGVGGVPQAINAYFHSDEEAELGDEGRLPPDITDVGAKLTTHWLRQIMLEGGRARPFMRTRMPQFGAAAVGAAPNIFPAAAGVWPDTDSPDPVVNSDLVQAGRRLVGVEGLNCISCHVVGSAPPAGTPGPDIYAFAERLRYDWWIRYVMAPGRIKDGTRMPAFFMTGHSAITDVLGGDPRKQADAMWAYFTLGEHAPPPDGLPRMNEFAVHVGERPVILRTFLRSAGSRGIAVGYPAGTHFAFDAENVRLVEAWRGSFLDASAAWAGRGGQSTDAQGTRAWIAPPGPAIIIGERPETWPTRGGTEAGLKFRGYSVDAAGVPTFMYDSGSVRIEERFEPTGADQILRTFTITGADADIWVNSGPHATGNTAIENVARVEAAGQDSMQLLGVTARDAGKPVRFSITITP